MPVLDVLGVGTDKSPVAPVSGKPANASRAIFAVSGIALLVVGWTDLALLWFPLRFGNPTWEFGAVSAHMDGMPLATVGLVLLAAAATSSASKRTTRVLSLWCWAIALALLAAIALFYLTVPLALRTSGEALQVALRRAILKTTIFSTIYIPLYIWLGFYLWRRKAKELGILAS